MLEAFPTLVLAAQLLAAILFVAASAEPATLGRIPFRAILHRRQCKTVDPLGIASHNLYS